MDAENPMNKVGAGLLKISAIFLEAGEGEGSQCCSGLEETPKVGTNKLSVTRESGLSHFSMWLFLQIVGPFLKCPQKRNSTMLGLVFVPLIFGDSYMGTHYSEYRRRDATSKLSSEALVSHFDSGTLASTLRPD